MKATLAILIALFALVSELKEYIYFEILAKVKLKIIDFNTKIQNFINSI